MSHWPLLLVLSPAAAFAALGAPAPPPPGHPPSPPLEDRLGIDAGQRESIFTYRVDGACNVTDTRKLQGQDTVGWNDVSRAEQITRQETVFRYVDGTRTQLRERRVKLLGEMVRTGELVCHVRPSGEVVNAWIERTDEALGRRSTPEREALTVRDGRIPDLGTFSLVVMP